MAGATLGGVVALMVAAEMKAEYIAGDFPGQMLEIEVVALARQRL